MKNYGYNIKFIIIILKQKLWLIRSLVKHFNIILKFFVVYLNIMMCNIIVINKIYRFTIFINTKKSREKYSDRSKLPNVYKKPIIC